MKTYTVSILKRVDITLQADDHRHAIKLAAPWWNGFPQYDGSLVLGSIEGDKALKSGLAPDGPPPPKPPTGPTPGTPVLEKLVVNG